MPKKILTDEEAIYAAVGRALTTWGGVEDALGRVFCAAVNPRNFQSAERAYWAVASFEGRLKMTSHAIEQRCLPRPMLPLMLPIWTPITEALTSKNTIRNKLAHGSVVNAAQWNSVLTKDQWVLAPYYHARKGPEFQKAAMKARPFVRENGDTVIPIDARPKERITLKQLGTFTKDFDALRERVEAFYLVVERQACAQEGVPLAEDPKNQRLTTILSNQHPAKT